MNRIIYFLCVTLVLFLVSSCFNDNEIEDDTSTDLNKLTLRLKDWSGDKSLNKQAVLWEAGIKTDFGNSILVVSYPIRFSDSRVLEKVVYSINNEVINGTVWTLIPDESAFDESYYAKSTHEILKSFTGRIKVRNIEKNTEENYYYTNGSINGLSSGSGRTMDDFPPGCSTAGCHSPTVIQLPEFCCVTPDPKPYDPFDPCNYSYNPCTCAGIGCPGGPGGGATWANTLTLLQSTPGKIANVTDYLKCFSASSGAKLSVYVDQPKANSRDSWSGSPTNPDVGHTFVEITQGGQTRIFGFYPDGGVNPFSSTPSATSKLVNDGGHAYDVKITTDLTATELQDVLNYVKAYNGTYNLNTFNCTDFGVQCMQKAGVSLTDTNGTWPGGGGSNPGDLGQDIRSLTSNSNYTVDKTSGTAPTNAGTCN